MIIKRIRIKNIRSYKEADISFPAGSTLLMGDIGSGKTSVLLAIEFALFGLQPGQKGNSLLRSNEDEAEVILEFEVEENNVTIERKLSRGGKSITQTEVSVTINNERFDGSVTEIKNKILSVLDYPPEFAKKTNDLYRFTVYTPQEEMKQIILESNDVRLNTLRHVFGIDKYKRIEENIDIFTSKLRQEIRLKEVQAGSIEEKNKSIEEKNGQISMHNSKLVLVEKEIEDIKKDKKNKQEEIEQLLKKLSEKVKLENEKEKAEITLNNKKEVLSNYEREIKTLNEQINIASSFKFNEGDIEINKNRIKAQEVLLRELNDRYIILSTNIQSSESKIRDLRILRDKISALEKCPTCLQLVDIEYKKNILVKAEQELRLLEPEYEKNKKEKTETYEKIEQTRKLIDSLKQSLSQLEILKVRLESVNEKRTKKMQIEKEKLAVFGDIDMMKKHIESINNMIGEFSSYQKSYDEKNIEIKDILYKENNLLIKRTEEKAEIQFLEKQIITLNEDIKKIEETQKKIAQMKELEFWINNKFIELVLYTEKNVMLKLREDFSKLFSEWFSILVSDNIGVRLDDGFSPVIQQNDYEIDYNFLSGGERTAVALAYRLALNQTINSVLSRIKTRDLVILDEPTDGFSDSQLDKMRDVLNELKVKQLILVSHEQKIEGFVDNIIRFRKKEGNTEVENAK